MEKENVIVYLADISKTDYETLYASFKANMEPKRVERIELAGNDKVKKELVATGALLQGILRGFGKKATDIAFEEKGKPYLPDCEDVYFNVSHSGNYVMIAFSGQPIGVDIQKIVPYKEALVNRICSFDERSKYSGDLIRHLNKIWAVKEAYSKLTGEGIGKDLSEVSFEGENDDLTISDKGEPSAKGKIVFSDDIYEAVVTAKEDFFVTAINRMNL